MSVSILRTWLVGQISTALCLFLTSGGTMQTNEANGIWKPYEYSEDGKGKAEEFKLADRLIIKDGTLEFTKDGKTLAKTKFVISGENYPKNIDFIDEKGVKSLGIITLKGSDFLYVAMLNDPEKRKTERPTDFTNAGKIIAVYQRVTSEKTKKSLSDSRLDTQRDRPGPVQAFHGL